MCTCLCIKDPLPRKWMDSTVYFCWSGLLASSTPRAFVGFDHTQLEHADHSMSIKSNHKDLEGSCISLDQVLSVAIITICSRCCNRYGLAEEMAYTEMWHYTRLTLDEQTKVAARSTVWLTAPTITMPLNTCQRWGGTFLKTVLLRILGTLLCPKQLLKI